MWQDCLLVVLPSLQVHLKVWNVEEVACEKLADFGGETGPLNEAVPWFSGALTLVSKREGHYIRIRSEDI